VRRPSAAFPRGISNCANVNCNCYGHTERGLATLLAQWFCPNLNPAFNYNRLAKQIYPEIRNPKVEIRKKPEIRIPRAEIPQGGTSSETRTGKVSATCRAESRPAGEGGSTFGLLFGFRPSVFFRPSGFGFRPSSLSFTRLYALNSQPTSINRVSSRRGH
jgi:hypothetical protein